MKLSRLFLGLTALVILLGAAFLGVTMAPANSKNEAVEPAGSSMAQAAQKFIGTLPDEQKAKASIAFDDKERTRWNFVPLQDRDKMPTRKGLRLEEMSKDSRAAALALLKAGTSAQGYTTATTIMSLEGILRDLEKGGAMVRNSGWYFVTIFGKPSKTDKWGWRIEGHHLSLNFTLEGNKIVSATPAFFGSNPATVKDGPRKGLRTLKDEDDMARELFLAFDDEQKKTAHQDKQFPETPAEKIAPAPGAPHGLAVAKMDEKQRGILIKLLQAYANRLPSDIAEVEMKQVKEAGIDKIHFAYAGPAEEGKPHSYRIQGPTFVVEFLNVQDDSAKNPANHIHSSWRSINGDFGLTAN